VSQPRYTFAYLSAAVEPETDNAFALIMPEVLTAAIQIFLDALAETIEPNEHVLMPLDRAGWHAAKDLEVPSSITLDRLPSRSPELNPVERCFSRSAFSGTACSMTTPANRRRRRLEAADRRGRTHHLALLMPLDSRLRR
jgi:DDE superfamily endonuclease